MAYAPIDSVCIVLANAAVFFAVAFFLGLGVKKLDWRVNYTRKAFSLVVLLMLVVTMPRDWSPVLVTWHARCPDVGKISPLYFAPLAVFPVCMLLFAEPLRLRSRFLSTAFLAIDRPEDRPHTLRWFVSSYVLTIIIALGMYRLAQDADYVGYHMADAVFIAAFVSGIGDALAEPIGIRFGRKTYRTREFLGDRVYERSYAGSACVFASAVIAVTLLAMQNYWGISGTTAALLVYPLALTLAEAKSPHTWDQPFIFLAAALAAPVFAEIAPILRQVMG